jgi:flagellar hook-associated protein 1 FlgK
MSDLLGIGTSGLLAFQRSLNTIGHNIANVNTEGYSRQSVDLVSRTPRTIGSAVIGTGVQTNSITRSFNAFAELGVRNSTSSVAEFQAFHTLASQLDNVLADPDAGISNSMQRFFNAMGDVAASPADSTAREVLLNEASNMAEQFNQLAGWLGSVRGQVNSNIRSSVTEINRLSDAIANVNESIVIAQGRSGGRPANDLLDQREVLIKELSAIVSVTTVQQEDGSLNVMAGSGQMLVVGNKATTLEVFVEAGDANQLGIAIRGNGGVLVPVTDQLTGGQLGGVVSFREQMLDPATNSLGLTAISIGHFVNSQQNQGMNLDGVLGNDFFNVTQPSTLTLAGAPGKVAVSFDDVSQLTNNDYTIRFNAGAWQLTQNDTNQVVAMAGSGIAGDPFIADGLRFEITAAPVNGDSYLIRPTRTGASGIEMVLANNREIAAAAPIRSLVSVNNTGSGEISAGVVSDINNPVFQGASGQLSPPVLVRFTATNSYDLYNNSNPAAPVLLEAGLTYNPATGGEVFPTAGGLDHGYRLQITGSPVADDEFTTEYNTAGVGDNRNALLMSALANNKLMANGTASINSSYSSLVADVGTGTKQAELNLMAQSRVLDQAIATRESVSGVNLDEEAANLIRYQQAYQAAAQVVSVANSLFDTLLSVTRR